MDFFLGYRDTKLDIDLLEDRLNLWIKEIEDIDGKIEKSIETSRSIPCRGKYYSTSPVHHITDLCLDYSPRSTFSSFGS